MSIFRMMYGKPFVVLHFMVFHEPLQYLVFGAGDDPIIRLSVKSILLRQLLSTLLLVLPSCI